MDWLTILIGVLVAAFVLFSLLPLWRARQARNRSVPELDALLNDAQRAQPRLLVYFWGPNCGMCRPMTPVIDRLAAETGAVIKINITESADLAKRFGVMATPSLAVVEHGVLKQVVVGGRTEPQIRALLKTG